MNVKQRKEEDREMVPLVPANGSSSSPAVESAPEANEPLRDSIPAAPSNGYNTYGSPATVGVSVPPYGAGYPPAGYPVPAYAAPGTYALIPGQGPQPIHGNTALQPNAPLLIGPAGYAGGTYLYVDTAKEEDDMLMTWCAWMGCLLSWIPIVGCINFACHMRAERGSFRALAAWLSLIVAVSVFIILLASSGDSSSSDDSAETSAAPSTDTDVGGPPTITGLSDVDPPNGTVFG
eukprot:Rmarinus@m.13074